MAPVRRLSALSFILLGSWACSSEREQVQPATQQDAFEIGRTILRETDFLASDEMAGRLAGTETYQQAADHVALRFRQMGLSAFGANAGYFQTVPLTESYIVPNQTSLSLSSSDRSVDLAMPEQFIAYAEFADSAQLNNAEIVFLGFGIQAPEIGHDDFASADVEGRVIAILRGAPENFGDSARAVYSSIYEKRDMAIANRAAGLIVLDYDRPSGSDSWDRSVGYSRMAEMTWGGTGGQLNTELVLNGQLSAGGVATLFELANLDVEETIQSYLSGTSPGWGFEVTATFASRFLMRSFTSPNVVGFVEGTDPALSHEYVLVSAHLDHLGLVGSIADPDAVYNGFFDNATGVATLLEIANAVNASPQRRSVIFVAFTAEEQGLVGSDYFAYHPPVPIENIVASINMDMPILAYPFADVEGYGAEHSSLNDHLVSAAAQAGLYVTPDSRPDLVRLIRSDQYSFVRRGIPGLNLKPGTNSTDPDLDGEALRDHFLMHNYHAPGDDSSQGFSIEAAEIYFQVGLNLVVSVASADERPIWNEGDFFDQENWQ